MPRGTTIIPGLHYRDAPGAIDFLCNVFGFERHLVVPGPDGTIEHAQLTFGTGMVMLGSVLDSEFHSLLRQPDEAAGPTLGIYVVVPDVDAHYAHAKAAGVTILIDIKDEDYGGRDYTCRDPEGYIWSFGSYDPWGAAAHP